ncbi:MAG: GIN domain-containing protein [Bacteroidia bacterium]
MKTSNKILIAFAAALILIPLMGMIYVSQVNYKTGSYTEEADRVETSYKNFNIPTENMESKVIASAFESVNVEDAKRLGLYINFVEDESYGVKVPKSLKDSISFTVDAEGILQIAFEMNGKKNNEYTTIIVYGKDLKKLNLSNANFLYIDVTADSLNLNIKKSGSITLNKDITLNSLKITTDEVKTVHINEVKVKSLQVELNGADFETEKSSYDNLSLNVSGKSAILLKGSENDGSYFIKNLVINTLNDADFKLENIKVEKCSGSFSDQTKVQMPALNLNQMYKK